MPKIAKDFHRLPKIFFKFPYFQSLKNIFLYLFTKLAAVVSGPGESSGSNQNVQAPQRIGNFQSGPSTILPGSEIYIRLPDDLVHKGILIPPPEGGPPSVENLSKDQALLLEYNNNNLIGNLEFYAYYRNQYYRDIYCYIKTSNNTIFAAKLEPYDYQKIPNVPSRIFVRIPSYNNPLFTGSLQPNPGYLPAWLRS